MTPDEDARPGAERVLDAVRAAPGGAAADVIAAQVGLHVTTVRFHLDRLVASGRVTAHTQASGERGRPRHLYQAVHTPDARAGMLAALADAAASGSGSASVRAQRAGEAWAEAFDDRRDAEGGPPLRDVLLEIFGALGFAPALTGEDVALRACPFLDDAQRHPDVVCGVHRGLAIGIARRSGASVGLEPFAPGGCLLTLD